MNKQPKKKKGLVITSIIAAVIVVGVIVYALIGNSNNYVAKVGDTKITTTELNEAMQKQYGSTVVQTLITNSVIEQEAKKQDVTVTQKEIDAEVKTQATQYGGTEGLESALESSNMTMNDFEESVKTYIQTQKLMEPTLEITDAKLKAYFKENKSSYDTAKQVKASHILVEDKKTAKKVAKLLADGGDWNKLAKKYSTDTSNASDGGNLGYFDKSSMDENFADAAFSMKKGEISDPVKSSYGYHIIKVTGIKSAKEATYADVKDEVRTAYVNEQMNANYSTWLADLEKDYDIDNTLATTSKSTTEE
ncbi:peptidyl-prolyl cis-trans isomerase [Kurthia sp. Dielmo]|uniref:peptidylprolyl isomerase n=1 Tax=Kurthia sp. Dielmo TaxID=1033738 RepID=UPI001121888D|nr:peptidyl-prolyl cis-trans isomerase [Kurthia sp. Dielmo]